MTKVYLTSAYLLPLLDPPKASNHLLRLTTFQILPTTQNGFEV